MMLLTKKEISYLAPMFPHSNPLGLFTAPSEHAEGIEAAALESKGVLQNGVLSAQAASLFAAAAEPEAASRVVLFNGPVMMEKFVYRMGKAYTLLETTSEGLRFSDQDRWDGLLAEYAQFLGGSSLQSAAFSLVLTPVETLAYFTLFDIERMRVMHACLGQSDDMQGASAVDVTTAASEPVQGSIVALLLSGGFSPSDDYASALETLVKKNVLRKESGTYLLPEENLMFARRFLLVQTGITLDLMQPHDGQVACATTLVLSASPIDHLEVSIGPDEVSISTVSAAGMLNMLGNALACPQIVQNDTHTILPTSHVMSPKPPALTPPPFSGNKLTPSEQPNMNDLNQWQCACGSKNVGLFCPKCGLEKPTSTVVQTIASSQPAYCKTCGAALSHNSSFCRNCGAKVMR